MIGARILSVPAFAAVLIASAGPAISGETVAGKIIKAAGVKAGLCVHLGATDGKLTAELSAGGKFVVHGLASDAAGADRARKYIQSKGVYGQVSVARSSFKKLPYAENLVNLIVAEDLPALLGKGLSLKEVARVLVPNGVACFGGKVDAARLKSAGFKDVKSSGGWTVAVKPRPKEMDDWPYYDHGPDGNMVAGDLLVGPALSLRWRTAMWSAHTAGVFSFWVSAGGRIFYNRRRRTPDAHRIRYVLTARDAYNGRLLWERPVKWAISAKYGARNVIATAERLYLPLEPGGPMVALDAATGETLKTYAGTSSRRTQVILHEGKLFGSGAWAVDVESGKLLWKRPGVGGPFVLADGQLIFASVYRRSKNVIVSLDPATGKERWEAGGGGVNLNTGPLYYRGTLVLPKGGWKGPHSAEGFSPKDGRRLWTRGNLIRKGGGQIEIYGAQGLVWVHARVEPNAAKKNAGGKRIKPSAWLGLDPATGEVKKRWDDATSDPAVAGMLGSGWHRCNRGTATERYCLFGDYEFFEWKTGKYHGTHNVTRSSCGVGMWPANGLVYTPAPTCRCRNFMQRGGFHAMAARPEGLKADDRGRLEAGPAKGASGAAAGKDDWPVYRQGPARHGATDSAVPSDLRQLWAVPVGRGPSAPTVAGGRVFVAAGEEHRVIAVDAASGKVRWSYTAGGRIDSPPTVSGGLAVFGCRDGWVYCLNAGNGKLVWRFRAAPVEEYILVDEQLESAWPVHGSVLVLNGVVYCAAGWHTGLDGGVTLWALRAGSGQVVWKKRLEKLPGDYRRANGPVALLSSDGEFLSMGQRWFDLKTGEKANARKKSVMSFGASGFLDNKWYEFSNTKGQLAWYDGRRRVRGLLLASGRERTCGVSVRLHRGYKNGMPKAGMGDFKLFGKKDSRDKGWTVTVPVRMRALVLAGGTLFAAGRLEPDLSEALKEKDPKRRAKLIAAMPDEKLIPRAAELWVCSAADGKKLGALKLDSPPVFDGMAAAGGKLYLVTQDGKLRCFGKK